MVIPMRARMHRAAPGCGRALITRRPSGCKAPLHLSEPVVEVVYPPGMRSRVPPVVTSRVGCKSARQRTHLDTSISEYPNTTLAAPDDFNQEDVASIVS